MRKQGKTLRIIWWIYIALLFVFVVVKFKGSFYELSDRISSYSIQGSINYNLIPFRSMSVQIERITQWWALKNLLGNIIPFIPFGFLLPVTYKKFSSAIMVLPRGFVSIVCGYLMFFVIDQVSGGKWIRYR